MAAFANPYFSKTSVSYIPGRQKAAMFVGELNAGAFAAIEGFLSREQKVKLTKALKSLGRNVDFNKEIDVLEEANFWGVQRGIASSIRSDEEIAKAVRLNQKMNALQGTSSPVNLDPAVIANVLGTWLKE